jgi:hypothetical protein
MRLLHVRQFFRYGVAVHWIGRVGPPAMCPVLRHRARLSIIGRCWCIVIGSYDPVPSNILVHLYERDVVFHGRVCTFERHRMPPSVRSLFRTYISPAAWSVLFNSIMATPCRLLGRFSCVSRTRSGKHAANAA